MLCDLHSAHGTFLNDQKLNPGQPVPLKGTSLPLIPFDSLSLISLTAFIPQIET